MLESASRERWGRLRSDISRLVAHRLPTRADVEDVVQEVLLRVWKHGDSVRDEERFGAWLSRVAYTAAADHLRARQKHPLARYAPAQQQEPGAAADPLPGRKAEGPEPKALIASVIRPFVDALPPPYREALVLSELDGLDHAVIAERLRLSVSGVKSRVQRGRHQLRRMLERCCEIVLDARGAPLSCESRPDGGWPGGCRCDESTATSRTDDARGKPRSASLRRG
jgi:RNA polymerase sigma-70 factor, ECF subfamily